MKQIISLIGSTNVGKSTLFNKLTNSNDAITSNLHGTTRDRNYGKGYINGYSYTVIDTGSFYKFENNKISNKIITQTLLAIKESTTIFFILNIKKNINLNDEKISNILHKLKKKTFLIANKAEGIKYHDNICNFYKLGFGKPYIISAKHGDGITKMMNSIFKKINKKNIINTKFTKYKYKNINISVIGRKNVGKSTFINKIIGQERLITLNYPGITRDSIYIKHTINNNLYTFIDTAGLQKKINNKIEQLSLHKTIKSIINSDVIIFLIDALDNITEQDCNIANIIIKYGKSIVIGINKCDKINLYKKKCIKNNFYKKFKFLHFTKLHFISSKMNIGIKSIINYVNITYKSSMNNFSTSKLTKILYNAISCNKHNNNIKPKLYYAHQGGKNPIIIIIHGRKLNKINKTYKRYLENHFRKNLTLIGNQIRIKYKLSKSLYID